MAYEGLLLENVSGSNYQFKKVSPSDVYYFIMTPETGNNSDGWVFYEFEQKAGKRIPCNGSTLFSPSHVLVVDKEAVDHQSALVLYYFRYRNYRLLRRFKRNTISSLIFFIFGSVICFWRMPMYAIALFPYLLVSGVLCFHFLYSYFHFCSECLSIGFVEPSKKPTRPGY